MVKKVGILCQGTSWEFVQKRGPIQKAPFSYPLFIFNPVGYYVIMQDKIEEFNAILESSEISADDMKFWKQLIQQVPADFLSYIADYIRIYPDSIISLIKTFKHQEDLIKKGDVESLLGTLSGHTPVLTGN
jgi:hypothetical protein